MQSLLSLALNPIESRLKPIEEKMNMVAEIKSSVDGFLAQIGELKSTVGELKDKNRMLVDANADLQRRVEELERGPGSRSVKDITKLEERIEAAERYSRRENLIVSGLPPPEPDEDPVGVATAVADRLGIKMLPTDVQACHRLPSKSDRKPLIIKFVNRHTKEALLKRAKVARLNAGHFGGVVREKVFVNEHCR